MMAILSTGALAADGKIYELRVYTAEPGRIADLESRLKSVSQLFAKHGMENVMEGVCRRSSLAHVARCQ